MEEKKIYDELDEIGQEYLKISNELYKYQFASVICFLLLFFISIL